MDYSNLKGKRLLIMGGGSQHCKVVEAAKELGVITYVVDNLEDAPAKQIADYHFLINVTETDKLAELCKEQKIDGIISGWFDFVQPHYQALCDRVGLPCYGDYDSFRFLTRKKEFEKVCVDNGVGTPTPLKIDDIKDELPFTVIVKPSNSRGSRGATICRSKNELKQAIEKAKDASFDGEYVIQRYMDHNEAFCVAYLFVNGEPYLEQLSDAFFGEKEWGLDRVAIAYLSPSRKSKEYVQKDGKVIDMLKNIGVVDGPFVAQGFFSGDDLLFFDPGRRFAGGEYERALKRLTGLDIPKAMIIYALTGSYPYEIAPIKKDSYLLNGKTTIRLQINVRAGVISRDEGFDKIQQMDEVEYVAFYHGPGDIIEATGNTHQRYAHIIVVADDTMQLKEAINKIYSEIRVYDSNNQNMIVSLFNPNLL